jgi:hypothetical protein
VTPQSQRVLSEAPSSLRLHSFLPRCGNTAAPKARPNNGTEGWIYAQLKAHFSGRDSYVIPESILSDEKARSFYKRMDRRGESPER